MRNEAIMKNDEKDTTMELEELKKSWSAFDKHLKEKELIQEEELSRLISRTGKKIHSITRLNIWLMLISLPVLLLFLIEILVYSRLNVFCLSLFILWIPAFCWEVLLTRFLQRTQVAEMPLIEVINRVNHIRRWMICEQLVAVAFLLLMAVFSFFYWQVGQYTTGTVLLFFLLWGGGLGLVLWIYRKKFLAPIRTIQKNLSELNELDMKL